jgi:hypothetical protein
VTPSPKRALLADDAATVERRIATNAQQDAEQTADPRFAARAHAGTVGEGRMKAQRIAARGRLA